MIAGIIILILISIGFFGLFRVVSHDILYKNKQQITRYAETEAENILEALKLEFLTNPNIEYQTYLTKFSENLPELIRIAQNKRTPPISEIDLIKDLIIFFEKGFDIQSVTQLSEEQRNFKGLEQVWVFAKQILDIDLLYDVVKENLEKGVQYVYFQHDTENFNRLKRKLSNDVNPDIIAKNIQCIIINKSGLLGADLLLYNPFNPSNQKGFLNRKIGGKTDTLFEMDSSSFDEIVSIYGSTVTSNWLKISRHKNETNIFNLKAS